MDYGDVMGYQQMGHTSYATDSVHLEKLKIGMYTALEEISDNKGFVEGTLNSIMEVLRVRYDNEYAEYKNPEMMVLGFLTKKDPSEGYLDKKKLNDYTEMLTNEYESVGRKDSNDIDKYRTRTKADIIRYVTFWNEKLR